MAETPVIQVLDKEHYFTQKLIPLPDELPYPQLGPSSLRLRTKAFTLSANNFAYCKIGFALGWWSFHPLPASTPAPYNDSAVYGRTNAWGYMEVIDSTLSAVPKGSFLFGYLPIGTLAQDVQFEVGLTPGQVVATSAHRRELMTIYNHYTVTGPETGLALAAKTPEAGLDVVLRVMTETAFLLNKFVFARNPQETVKPSAQPMNWTGERADLTDATLIFLAPGSKVALILAQLIKNDRSSSKPKRVIGAASDYSKTFVETTRKYDAVVSTSKSPAEFLPELGVDPAEKVILVDFGGRAGLGQKWTSVIAPAYKNFLLFLVGSELSEVSQANALKALAVQKPDFAIQVNASDMREEAIKRVGEAEYLAGLSNAVKSVQSAGINGLKVIWGEGMEDAARGWDRLAKGDVGADEGLAFLV
ncbi:hypothetical protein V2G26_003079 [Clonostachys chloroleuca]